MFSVWYNHLQFSNFTWMSLYHVTTQITVCRTRRIINTKAQKIVMIVNSPKCCNTFWNEMIHHTFLNIHSFCWKMSTFLRIDNYLVCKKYLRHEVLWQTAIAQQHLYLLYKRAFTFFINTQNIEKVIFWRVAPTR